MFRAVRKVDAFGKTEMRDVSVTMAGWKGSCNNRGGRLRKSEPGILLRQLGHVAIKAAAGFGNRQWKC